MKKLISYVLFFILLCHLVHGNEKKVHKKNRLKIQKYNYSCENVLSFDGATVDLDKLKRRYPRKYNIKYNDHKLDPDDYGYPQMYNRQQNKKACKV